MSRTAGIATPVETTTRFIAIASVLFFCVILSIIGYYNVWRDTTTVRQPAIALTKPVEAIVSNPTQPQLPVKTPPAMVLGQTTHGLIIFLLDRNEHVCYGLGTMFVPPNGKFPLYDFPLFVSKTERGGPWQVITSFPDPNIEKIGGEWKSKFITDPDHKSFILQVKLTRVEEPYKYKTEFMLSPDNGSSWLPPANYPVE